MSRLPAAFDRLRANGGRGLVAYLTAGDPDRARSRALLTAVAAAGADVLEVGVPFSDPLADGPVIQRATERALAAGMTLGGVLDLVRDARRDLDTPIVLFTYGNPVVRMGVDRFAGAAADAGVDGVLVLDYPPEELAPLRDAMLAAGLDPILLVSPTTTDQRMRRAAALGRGFLYLISRLGVTGAREQLPSDVGALAARARTCTDLPLALGFGISTPAHVGAACRVADAAVVGSALVRVVEEHAASPGLCDRAAEFVTWLKRAT